MRVGRAATRSASVPWGQGLAGLGLGVLKQPEDVAVGVGDRGHQAAATYITHRVPRLALGADLCLVRSIATANQRMLLDS